MRHLKQSLYHFPPTYHRVNGYHLVTQKPRIVSKSAILNLGGKCARVGMEVLTVSSVACFGVKSASLYITSFKGVLYSIYVYINSASLPFMIRCMITSGNGDDTC